MRALSLTKKIARVVVSLFLLLVSSGIANAVSMSPALIELSAKPGDVLTGQVTIGNSADTIKTIVCTKSDIILDPLTNTQQYVDYDAPRGLKNWLTLDFKEVNAEPEEEVVIPYTISIPDDAAPGTYLGGIFGQALEPSVVAGGTNLGVSARAVATIVLNVEGEYTENLDFISFDVNKTQLLKGNIIFESTFKNGGTVRSTPTGNIKIFDLEGNQVEKVFLVTEEYDGKPVVVDRKNEIPFNKELSSIFPETTKTIETKWINGEFKKGEYKAVIEAFDGKNKAFEKKEIKLEVYENLILKDFVADKYFNTNFPVNFTAKLINTGNISLEPSGYFAINNVFGMQKVHKSLDNSQLTIGGGEEKEINGLSWENGLGLGLYKATLSIDLGGKIYQESAYFWSINILQLGIVLFVLLVVIFGGIKLVISYKRLKDKVTKSSK
ncbi:hypothetical protein C0416_02500 [bacterium]|nr:hypothetical protein [bacterium]